MRILGLQGSPRRNGNSNWLLSTFMEEAQKLGAVTRTVNADKQHILPCREYVVCEKKGYCPIDDDMKNEIYSLLRWADVIVAASPVFFYNVTAQLKALIDRCQTLWARKYRLKLRDPGAHLRLGCSMSVGATQGKSLFDGVHLTMKYFFDAVDARFAETLEYRGIEKYNDMAAHATARNDVGACAARLLSPFMNRKRILFVSSNNSCRSQMAEAFARSMAGERIEACSGGLEPSEAADPLMVSVMAEKGIDMAFLAPKSLDAALQEGTPRVIVSLGCGVSFPLIPEARVETWDIPAPGGSLEEMRSIRDTIEKKVAELIGAL